MDHNTAILRDLSLKRKGLDGRDVVCNKAKKIDPKGLGGQLTYVALRLLNRLNILI